MPLAEAAPEGDTRLVDGVPVKTYRGASLAEIAPKIRAELGDNVMILRQREGVTGGFAGFFAKRTVEVDVAVIGGPSGGRVDVVDDDEPVGPAFPPRPGQPEPAPITTPRHAPASELPPVPPVGAAPAFDAPPSATVSFDALRPPLPPNQDPAEQQAPAREPAATPQPADPAAVPFSAFAEQHGLPTASHPQPAAHAEPTPPPVLAQQAPAPAAPSQPVASPQPPAGPAPGANPYTTTAGVGPAPAFTVGPPSAADAAGLAAALQADQARQAAERAAAQQAQFAQPAIPPYAQSYPQPPVAQQQPVQQPPVQQPIEPAIPPVDVPWQSTAAQSAPAAAFEPLAYPHDQQGQAVPAERTPIPAPAFEPPLAAPFEPSVNDEPFDAPFDAGQRGAAAAPVEPTSGSFEDRLRSAGLDAPAALIADPVAELTPLHAALLRRGLPDQIASPVTDDTLCHRVPLQPDRAARDLLASELARRIPTAPLAGRAGQAVAFVGSSGAGKTRAIARLAAAYGAAGRVPVACVTLHSSGDDGLLASALAPYGIAVHAAPDIPRALDRITALRRHALVLVDTPGVSPGDRHALDRLGATLDLLELDQVALCLPVVLAAPIARRVLRAMRPLGPTMLVATHADEADLLGGVVAVAIDRRVPLAYVSAGAGRGSIAGADAHEIASALIGPETSQPRDRERDRTAPERATAWASRPISKDPLPSVAAAAPLQPEPDVDEPAPTGPSVDVAAGAQHIAAPWIVSTPLRERRPRRK